MPKPVFFYMECHRLISFLFFSFSENRFWHFMQMKCQSLFSGNKTKQKKKKKKKTTTTKNKTKTNYFKMSSEFFHTARKVSEVAIYADALLTFQWNPRNTSEVIGHLAGKQNSPQSPDVVQKVQSFTKTLPYVITTLQFLTLWLWPDIYEYNPHFYRYRIYSKWTDMPQQTA